MDRDDIAYMVDEGVMAYFKKKHSDFDFPTFASSFKVKFEAAAFSVVKFFTYYMILNITYEKIGLEKFLIMILAGVIASYKTKEMREKASKVMEE